MKFIKRLLNMRGINTENINMIVAFSIFLAMILYSIFKDIIWQKIKKEQKPENKKEDNVKFWSMPGLRTVMTTDYSEMKLESDGSLVASKTLKGPILEATPIKGKKRKIKTKKELCGGDNDGLMEVTNPEIKKKITIDYR